MWIQAQSFRYGGLSQSSTHQKLVITEIVVVVAGRENCGLFSWFCDGNILMTVIALVCNGYLPCKIGLDL